MLPPVVKLLQPGDSGQWQELAACYSDERFTGNKPDPDLAEELLEICLGCEVFWECRREYAAGATGVFAGGEWRE